MSDSSDIKHRLILNPNYASSTKIKNPTTIIRDISLPNYALKYFCVSTNKSIFKLSLYSSEDSVDNIKADNYLKWKQTSLIELLIFPNQQNCFVEYKRNFKDISFAC